MTLISFTTTFYRNLRTLSLSDSEYTIIPDSTMKYSIYFISTNGDTINKGEYFDVRYHLGYNLGTIYIKCPNSKYPITEAVKGKEYWFSLTVPVFKEQNVKFILFNLHSKIKFSDNVYIKTFQNIINLPSR